MPELREQLVELAEAGAREARVPGADAAVRRGRRRRRQLMAATVLGVLVLAGGVVAVDRWAGGWGGSGPPTGGRPRPSATTLQPIDPARMFWGPESPKPAGPLRQMAEGTFKGRHWAFYLFRGRAAPPDPPGERWCNALVDWRPDGRLAGWNVGCGLEQELRRGRELTWHLDEPVENRMFVYHGTVTRQAARIRFQIGDQPPFEARIVDLGAQFPYNWYVAVFSPRGGTRTMLDRNIPKTATVLDASGRVICTSGSEPDRCG